MFGSLRLVLAMMVVALHAGFMPMGLYIGTSAVVVFYMLSGYAMTGLLLKRFHGPGGTLAFYGERWLRLAPQYYLWLAVSAVFAVGLGFPWAEPVQMPMRVQDWAAHLAILPLGLFVYLPMLVQKWLMPQAGSLGIETMLYLVFPFMLRYRLVFWTMAALSFGVLAAAFVAAISPVAYGYYSFPGTLAYFLLGHALFMGQRWKIVTALLAFAAIFIASAISGQLSAGFNTEILLGVVAGFAAMSLLAKRPTNTIDQILGDASYGCFLSHYAFIQVMRYAGILQDNPVAFTLTVLAASAITGWLSYRLVEYPTISLRRRLKARQHQMPTMQVPAIETPAPNLTSRDGTLIAAGRLPSRRE
jgi:peptidoglycan/LPS O-acetylase OafA/YrhL